MGSSVNITGATIRHAQLSRSPVRNWTEPFRDLSPASRLDRLADIVASNSSLELRLPRPSKQGAVQ